MLEFVGQPNIAMLIAAGFSIFTYARQMLRNQPELKGKLAKALSEKLESPWLRLESSSRSPALVGLLAG